MSMNEGSIYVLGSGTSEGVPIISCLVKNDCETCNDAQQSIYSKNKRRNTCIAVCVENSFDEYYSLTKSNVIESTEKQEEFNNFMKQLKEEEGDKIRSTIIIDVGKFFWQSAIDLFPKLGLKRIESVLITHAHIDAMGGFDDLRDWTRRIQPGYSIPIFCEKNRDFGIIKSMFPYIVNVNQKEGLAISSLTFNPNLIAFLPVNLFGLEFIPLPVFHGRNYVSFGYKFGDIVYISDCCGVPACTTELINGVSLPDTKDSFEKLDLTEEQINSHNRILNHNFIPCKTLIIDCLSFAESTHPSHFLIGPAMEYLASIQDPKPSKVYFTGISHRVNHEKHSLILKTYLEQYGLDIELLFDGQHIPFSYENNLQPKARLL